MEFFLFGALLVALIAIAALAWTNRAQAARLTQVETAWHEQELHHSKKTELLVAMNSVTTNGFVLLNKDGRIISLNAAARSFLGVENGIGQPLSEIAWGYDLQPLVAEVLQRKTDSLEQVVAKGERAFAVRVQSIGTSSDPRVLLRLDEVTELQRLGRARREFVANISHELRTPVTSLQLLVETITAETMNDKSFLFDLLDKMRAQIDLLRQLTDELMDLALIESGHAPIKLMETRAVELVNEAANSLRPQAERKGIDLDVAVDADMLVLADAQGIRKVLGNLIHNAIKFTNARGRIEISATRDGDNVRFAVADTGIGISANDLPRVFERFYKVDRARTRGAGELRSTGLGLAIAKHTVEAHGGKIWAESVEGKGSIFFFTLPAA
ncbi:MAG: PAS domain-containing sensor histidine kinase [Chloroflexi bacterium]|nr:PAS domain-containing sensor histidine kinase [Chloroflexota bacterium]